MNFGGNLGSGGYFGGGPNTLGPGGPYGAWPGCGCSSIFILLAVMFLLFGGCLRTVGF